MLEQDRAPAVGDAGSEQLGRERIAAGQARRGERERVLPRAHDGIPGSVRSRAYRLGATPTWRVKATLKVLAEL